MVVSLNSLEGGREREREREIEIEIEIEREREISFTSCLTRSK